jgi:hypothetical protein
MQQEPSKKDLTKEMTAAAVQQALARRSALTAQYGELWWEIWRSIEGIDDTGKPATPPANHLREATSAGLNCPAAPPHWKGATVFGVVAGAEGIPVEPEPITPHLLESIAPATPRETFRITATCVKRHCRQWASDQPGAQGDGVCTLAQRIVANRDEIRRPSGALPACAVRPTCRWFAQHGGNACRVCPQVSPSQEDQ